MIAAVALGVALLGVLIMWLRGRRERRRQEQSAGQIGSPQLPHGEFVVWRSRYLVGHRAGRVSLEGGVLRWTPTGALQPDQQVAASEVRFRVLRPSRWVDLTRIRVQLPGGRPFTMRVSREDGRPIGALDSGYEMRLEGYQADFVDRLRRAGAVEGGV